MNDRTRSAIIRPSLIALAAVGALVAGACSSDDPAPTSVDTESTTTSEATTTTPETTSTTEGGDTEQASDLVGTWTASAASIFAANTANLGGPGLTECAGDIVMQFSDIGTISRSGNVSCGMGGLTAEGTISTTAEYATPAPGRLTVSDTVTLGVVTLGGREVPFPDSFGDGEGTYTVDGSTLTIVFNIAPVGEVTQVYTRV